MSVDLNTVLRSHFVQAVVRRVCGDDIEIIKRPAAFMLRKKEEDDRDIERIIILPPKGYTANALNQTNSHNEAEHATIRIRGGVREGKKGFSRLQNCLLVAAFHKKDLVSDLDQPYLTFDLKKESTPDLFTALHSAGEPAFPVVKANGFGFYHNLINTTDDWLVLQLRKKLRPQKPVDLKPYLEALPENEANALAQLYEGIMKHGDTIFNRAPGLIEEVCQISPEHSLPALGEMLYIYDTGRHEACTAFAVILKIGKMEPEKVTEALHETLRIKSVPEYYAKQLIEKIERFRNQLPPQDKPQLG